MEIVLADRARSLFRRSMNPGSGPPSRSGSHERLNVGSSSVSHVPSLHASQQDASAASARLRPQVRKSTLQTRSRALFNRLVSVDEAAVSPLGDVVDPASGIQIHILSELSEEVFRAF
jgi:hypothetical protein